MSAVASLHVEARSLRSWWTRLERWWQGPDAPWLALAQRTQLTDWWAGP